jgi:3-deoxy-7-phosphoheptulonate synthase
LLIEVHPTPAEALSDGQQQLDPPSFASLVTDLGPYLSAAGRVLPAQR